MTRAVHCDLQGPGSLLADAVHAAEEQQNNTSSNLMRIQVPPDAA